MRQIRGHLSYANVAATLALVFAMSGGAIAATGGFTAASSTIKACAGSNGVLKLQTGKKCKKGQKAVSWSQRGPTGAAGASGLAGLTGGAVPSATKAAEAATATTAQTANNALALGGLSASAFTQRGCDSDTGQVKGYAAIPASISSTNFVPLGTAYNCSGQIVEAEKAAGSAGIYFFRFPGNPAEVALATVETGVNENSLAANVHATGPGEWRVVVFSGNELRDEGVSLVLF